MSNVTGATEVVDYGLMDLLSSMIARIELVEDA
jgi:hypothetical protein